jgi:hypothetical protein
LKAKIKLAMEQGVTQVFGAVANNKLTDKLAGRSELFNDRNYNVYLRPGDRAMAAARGTGGSMRPSAQEFEDPEAGFYDANSQNGSFMSATEVSPFSQSSMLCALQALSLPLKGQWLTSLHDPEHAHDSYGSSGSTQCLPHIAPSSPTQSMLIARVNNLRFAFTACQQAVVMQGTVFATPRNSIRDMSLGPMSIPSMAREQFDEPYPEGDDEATTRPPVAGRRNLRNWRFEKPRTDFEVWEQAENALQNGVTVQELVRREFANSLGPQSVRCVFVPLSFASEGQQSEARCSCTEADVCESSCG